MVAARDCVPAALAELLRTQPVSRGKIAFAWRAAVGAALDRVSEVELGPHGRLHVCLAGPLWRREIERSAELILTRLETLLGAGVVKRIVVRSD